MNDMELEVHNTPCQPFVFSSYASRCRIMGKTRLPSLAAYTL